jgi:hypothetical protein
VSRTPHTARRLFDRFEPLHALTYFAPEALQAFEDAGFRGFWMGYFAGRAAPLGRVPSEVVTAAFYNFSAAHVRRALPDAWDFASPADTLRVRESSAVAALARCGVIADEATATTADLLERAARTAPLEGRPLFAANRALPWPDDPVARLWHATTLLREQRGDGHVALLVAADISGRQANVLHCIADRVPRDFIMLSRRYDDAEWQECVEALAARGLVDGDGLTDAGRHLKQDLEDGTDRLGLAAFAALDDDEIETLFRTLTPLTRKVVAGGDIPVATPMGLQRDDLDDEDARVR